MRNTLYATVAACLAMLATSGIIVYATAAPPSPDALRSAAESEIAEQLDAAIGHQLEAVKGRLAARQR